MTFDDPIARTARITAAARAVESAREAPLFVDPYARALAGDDAVRAFVDAEQPMRAAFLAVRTRWLDEAILAAIAAGVRDVVSLAAGLDTRPLRLPLPSGVRWLECDRAEVLAYKRRALAGAPARADVRDVAGDVRDPALLERLAAAGLRDAKAAFVLEGLVMYLAEPEVRALLDRLARAPAGSVVLFDAPSRAALDPRGTMAEHLASLAASGAPWRFGTDDPVGLVAASGLRGEAVRVGDPRAHFGRLPWPASPSPPPHGAVMWLVTARR